MRDDYYELLGLTSAATPKEVTRAYRQLSLKFHPDKVVARGGNPDSATEAFSTIREAYDVLSDRAARRKYDTRASWMSSHPEQITRPATTCNVVTLPPTQGETINVSAWPFANGSTPSSSSSGGAVGPFFPGPAVAGKRATGNPPSRSQTAGANDRRSNTNMSRDGRPKMSRSDRSGNIDLGRRSPAGLGAVQFPDQLGQGALVFAGAGPRAQTSSGRLPRTPASRSMLSTPEVRGGTPGTVSFNPAGGHFPPPPRNLGGRSNLASPGFIGSAGGPLNFGFGDFGQKGNWSVLSMPSIPMQSLPEEGNSSLGFHL
mmetsp:Transcript_22114/g.39703  ORF Transcript_22114/g.39703 Transcript_22114/m.39703 type:complete len:315 (+) Transcript_22114:79-1023(+)